MRSIQGPNNLASYACIARIHLLLRKWGFSITIQSKSYLRGKFPLKFTPFYVDAENSGQSLLLWLLTMFWIQSYPFKTLTNAMIFITVSKNQDNV